MIGSIPAVAVCVVSEADAVIEMFPPIYSFASSIQLKILSSSTQYTLVAK